LGKYIVLGIIAFIFLLIYLRLRPFIRMARQMFGVAREAQRVVRNEPATSRGAGDKLVRCAACGTWTPTSSAVKLRSSNLSYCSHTCLESAAQGSKRKAAS